jgi:predicted transcriptional regulator
MAKTHALSFRLEPELKQRLEKAAKADRRSLSSLVEKILADWVQDQGDTIPIRKTSAEPSGGSDVTEDFSATPKRARSPRTQKTAPISKETQLPALRE